MVSKKTIVDALPPFQGKIKIATWAQSVDRLMKEIVKAHDEYRGDYAGIYEYFDTGNIYTTCRDLWEFCKFNLPYTIEGENEQSVKSPAAILQKGEKVDCKHYSLFIGGVLGALQDHFNEDWTWCYRFACYDSTSIPEHVFVVVFVDNKEIWVDPVLTSFNEHKQPKSYIDKKIKIMPVYSISGIGKVKNTMPEMVEIYDVPLAESRFFVMVNLNLFGLKDILNSDKTVLYNPVRSYFLKNGFDFEHLLVLLKQ